VNVQKRKEIEALREFNRLTRAQGKGKGETMEGITGTATFPSESVDGDAGAGDVRTNMEGEMGCWGGRDSSGVKTTGKPRLNRLGYVRVGGIVDE